MRRDVSSARAHPERPPGAAAAVERLEERERAERASRRGRGCTSARRRRGTGTASSARRARLRRARRAARRAARRGAPRAAGSRARTTAEAIRRPPSPNPRCATAQATRKWSGAPPRSRVTCSTTPGSESRPTKSASVSSSWGGQAISWWRRNAAGASVTPPTPSHSHHAATRTCGEGRAAAVGAVSTRASIPCVIGVSAILAGRLAVRCRSTSTAARTGTPSRCSSG